MLPPEILENVFRFCCLNASASRRQVIMNGISRTCCIWRAVALAMPWLWSSLKVQVSDSSSIPSPAEAAAYLNRSGTHPLTLALVYHQSLRTKYHHQSHRGAVYDILNIFLSHIHHWRAITFHLDNLHPNQEFPVISTIKRPLRAPLLRCVDITGSAWFFFPSPQTRWLTSILASAPFLTTFRSNGEFPLVHLTVPWSRLTRLHLLSDISLSRALDIMEEAFALIECYLLRIVSHEKVPKPNRRIITTRLRSLVIVSKVPVDNLFAAATFPVLSYLAINCAPKIPLDYSTFMGFLIRSGCNITTFCVQPSCMETDDLMLYLDHLSPTLINLQIRTSDAVFVPFRIVNMDIIERLTYTGAFDYTLCPNLETLAFERCMDVVDGDLSRMIESRWRLYHPLSSTGPTTKHDIAHLQRVDLALPSACHPLDVEVLTGLFDEGLAGGVTHAYGSKMDGYLPYQELLFATYPVYQLYIHPKTGL